MAYDFSGWATKNDLKCSDGRMIMRDAFKDDNGKTVPIVWSHIHSDIDNVLGHGVLENKEEGVYFYGEFNDTPKGRTAKELVKHGDISALSIWANELKQRGSDVMHGVIKEVSLVLAGANPGAVIDSVLAHGEVLDDEAIIINADSELVLAHSDEKDAEDSGAKKKEDEDSGDETIAEIINGLSEKQKNAVYAIVGSALEAGEDDEEDDDDEKSDHKEGGNVVKHNVFDNETQEKDNVLSHSAQEEILKMAKASNVGSLRAAINMYLADNSTLAHGFDEIENLFPEYKDVRPGAPELLERDQGWVSTVMSKVHKSPISRIRTRQMDARGDDLRAYGYVKGSQKAVPGNAKLLKRTTDPQTVYRKDALERDDIIDITDFDVVDYQYRIMRQNLNEELALAIMVGDGREDGDTNKIYEEHIRSIWHDDDLYTIHYDVDIDAAKAELQGTNTSANFGENYIYAEAIITAALYSREKYKGSGTPDFYCTPHLLNVMLLARDLNGRRIYDSATDLARALNVGAIYTAEQFEGLTRTTSDNKTKELLGIFVNLANYSVGSTKGGEITRFNQFDIDFNQEKYLIETRVSGALTRVYSAIALEMDVTDSTDDEDAA